MLCACLVCAALVRRRSARRRRGKVADGYEADEGKGDRDEHDDTAAWRPPQQHAGRRGIGRGNSRPVVGRRSRASVESESESDESADDADTRIGPWVLRWRRLVKKALVSPHLDAPRSRLGSARRESIRSSRRAAAVSIQKRVRGRGARRARAPNKGLASNRPSASPSRGTSRREAAMSIQARVRGREARKAAAAEAKARAKRADKKALGTSRREAAMSIQARIRGRKGRREADAKVKARAKANRPRGVSRREAAMSIQARVRGREARKEAAATRSSLSYRLRTLGADATEAAAVAIQRQTRGVFGRKAAAKAAAATVPPKLPSEAVAPSICSALGSALDDARTEAGSLSRKAPPSGEQRALSRKRAVAFVSAIGSPPALARACQKPSIGNVALAIWPTGVDRLTSASAASGRAEHQQRRGAAPNHRAPPSPHNAAHIPRRAQQVREASVDVAPCVMRAMSCSLGDAMSAAPHNAAPVRRPRAQPGAAAVAPCVIRGMSGAFGGAMSNGPNRDDDDGDDDDDDDDDGDDDVDDTSGVGSILGNIFGRRR